MATSFNDNLGSAATPVTITATTLASSATVGRQSDAITLLDGNKNVPQAIDVELSFTLNTGTIGSDKAAYLFAARSTDETNYEVGPPAVGASDAGFTFSNSPVGTTPLPTDLILVGAITANAQSEVHRKMFRMVAPPAKLVFVVLNFTGIAFTACAIQYRKRYTDGR
jgi:hypothetical protein